MHAAAIKVIKTANHPTLLRRNLATRGTNNEPANGIPQHSHEANSRGISVFSVPPEFHSFLIWVTLHLCPIDL